MAIENPSNPSSYVQHSQEKRDSEVALKSTYVPLAPKSQISWRENSDLNKLSSNMLKEFYERTQLNTNVAITKTISSESLNSVSTVVSSYSDPDTVLSTETESLYDGNNTPTQSSEKPRFPLFVLIHVLFLEKKEHSEDSELIKALKTELLKECEEEELNSILSLFDKFSIEYPKIDESKLIFLVEREYVIDALEKQKILPTPESNAFLVEQAKLKRKFSGAKTYKLPGDRAKKSASNSFDWSSLSFPYVAAFITAIANFFVWFAGQKNEKNESSSPRPH